MIVIAAFYVFVIFERSAIFDRHAEAAKRLICTFGVLYYGGRSDELYSEP